MPQPTMITLASLKNPIRIAFRTHFIASNQKIVSQPLTHLDELVLHLMQPRRVAILRPAVNEHLQGQLGVEARLVDRGQVGVGERLLLHAIVSVGSEEEELSFDGRRRFGQKDADVVEGGLVAEAAELFVIVEADVPLAHERVVNGKGFVQYGIGLLRCWL